MKPIIEILVGIPCSGKSTYCYLNECVISRDTIRENLFIGKYKFSKQNEQRVTNQFDNSLLFYIENKEPLIILDNTHCKEIYIDNIIEKYQDVADIKITFFDIPLWKAYYRNVKRYIQTNKWIPFKVIKNMKKNYDSINREKYKQYT